MLAERPLLIKGKIIAYCCAGAQKEEGLKEPPNSASRYARAVCNSCPWGWGEQVLLRTCAAASVALSKGHGSRHSTLSQNCAGPLSIPPAHIPGDVGPVSPAASAEGSCLPDTGYPWDFLVNIKHLDSRTCVLLMIFLPS